MAIYAGKPSSFYSATGGKPVEGAWYSGQRYMGGQLLAPGEYEPGKLTSNETISQTSPDNVQFIQQQREIQANQLQPLTNFNMSVSDTSMPSLNTQVETYRRQLEETLGTRRMEVDTKLQQLREKEQKSLDSIGELSQPFREELEKAERERLYVNENFEANQSLVNELEQLLTEGNELIRQQQEVTGLASVRNPRIQKTMNDVQARVGVIEAVINARNGQIAQAQNLIDRSANAIAADRNDQINYYKTIISLNERDILSLDAESKELANYQISLIQGDLDRAEATADYVKQLMLDPTTAGLMGEAGVKLTDSVEQINAKLSQAQTVRDIREQHNQFTAAGYQPIYDTSGIPKNQLKSFTDSTGKVHYYKEPPKPLSQTELNAEANDWATDVAFNGSATVKNDDGKNVTITAEDLDLVSSVFEGSLAPQFSAAIGTVFTDSYGRKWQFTSRGWIRI